MNPVSQQLIEIWILYTIGILIIAARVFCRTKLVGYKNYDWDDYLVVLVGVRMHLFKRFSANICHPLVLLDCCSHIRANFHSRRQRTTHF